MADNELKACPFCGGEPLSKWRGCSIDGSGHWGIGCCISYAQGDDIEEATAAWNLRAEPAVQNVQAGDERITSETTTAIAKAVHLLEKIVAGRMPLATRRQGRKINVQDIARMAEQLMPELLKAQFDILSCHDAAPSQPVATQEDAGKVQANILGQCCHGGMKRKKDCASCAAWPVRPISQPSNAVHSVTDEQIAETFHAAYERLAPSFFYETQAASRLPWADVPPNNKALMIATCKEVRALLPTANAGKEEKS